LLKAWCAWWDLFVKRLHDLHYVDSLSNSNTAETKSEKTMGKITFLRRVSYQKSKKQSAIQMKETLEH